ncbi:hypothetical protein [Galactobacter valiniphilus]|uniref:hypothetical protein n=1 Tax=Galactobacter valiniphilus TaxID=2676122 RepID=UPI003735BEFF
MDFQIQRDLTGGGLPGAARGGSGFSVASGSVTLPMGRAELTPWATASKRVAPGGLAWFRAHPTTLTSITLGRFIVDECSAGSFGGLSLDLVESQRQMDGPFTYPWQYDSAAGADDAASALAAAAEAGGYSTSWHPTALADTTPSTIIARLDGTIRSQSTGVSIRSASGVTWASLGGQAMLGPGAAIDYSWPSTSDGDNMWWYWTTGGPRFSLVVGGTGCVVEGNRIQGASSYPSLRWVITPSSVTLYQLAPDGTAVLDSQITLPATTAPTRPMLVAAQGTLLRVTDLATGIVYSTARSNSTRYFVSMKLATPAGGYVRDLVIEGGQSVTYKRPTALIEHTGSPLRGVFDVAGKSSREVFQDIAKSTMGAGWQSETGDLMFRNASSLRTGRPVEAVVATEKLEDLRWSISRDNSADRVTVSYTPAEVQTDSAHKITLWEATEPIMVPGNRTVTVTAEITGTTDRISPFSIVTANAADAANATYSRWHASSSREGGGTRPTDDAIRIETKITGPSTVRLSITNTTSGTLWLVDGNGNPLVILRTSLQVQPGETQKLEWGQPEDKALNPFDFDSGQWVQDATTAQAMLAWLVDQLRSPLPTITQVRIIPDLRRQLGDIVTLTDEDSGLKAKALIIGISLEGDAGGYTQRLTLAILSVTYSDVKRWAKAQGITTYGQLKAHLVANGATTYKLAREYLARVGVDA